MRKIFFLSFCFLLFLCTATQAHAEEKIEQFLVDIEVFADNSVAVTEKILYDFDSNERRGIIRNIPRYYELNSGGTISANIDLLSVTDENGAAYEYQETESNYLDVRIGNPDIYLSGAHWYYISYRVDQVINGFADHDELYWNATGNMWSVPIEYAEANITIPVGSSIQNNQAACYTGYIGSQSSDCSAEVVSAQEFVFRSEELSSYNGLTIAAGFEKSVVTLPSLLYVSANISYADVLLNDEVYNISLPHTFRITPGTYTVTISDSDHYPQTQTIDLATGEQEVIYLELQALPEITVDANIRSANIVIEGSEGTETRWGYFPETLSLLPGNYTISLEESGYYAESTEVVVTKGGNELFFTMRKTPLRLFLEDWLPILGTLFVSWLFWRRWLVHGRDPEGRGVYVRYEPPETMNPGEVGVLWDEEAHLHDISASIVHLAVQGYLKIQKTGEGKYDYTFVKKKDIAENDAVPEYEKNIFTALFGDDVTEKKLSDLKYKFYKDLEKIKRALYDRLVKEKYFTKAPDKTGKGFLFLTFFFFIGGSIAGGGLWAAFGAQFYFVGALLLGLQALVYANIMGQKTPKGAETFDHIKGFRIFLKSTEKKMLDFLNAPENYTGLFEKYLPYAMVLGVEEQWAKKFKDLYKTPPYFYEGSGSFTNFIDDFSRFSRYQQKVFVSRPAARSSGSYSGWSGGSSSWSGGSGFSSSSYSGGGFGGGGGSSW